MADHARDDAVVWVGEGRLEDLEDGDGWLEDRLGGYPGRIVPRTTRWREVIQ